VNFPPLDLEFAIAGARLVVCREGGERRHPSHARLTWDELEQLARDTRGAQLSPAAARALIAVKEVFGDARIIDGRAERQWAAEMRSSR
jgi:hypothetical protein